MECLGTGRRREEKPEPAFLDVFGWCTWDAFYKDVSHEKVREGLDGFRQAGIQPRSLILDDGWQSVEAFRLGGERLTSFAANEKFPGGLKETVDMARDEFGVETFMVWHAVNGYWGGVDAEAMSDYRIADAIPRGGPDQNIDWVLPWVGYLIGVVHPDSVGQFYNDYCQYLAAQGVSGTKVDNQGSLQYLADGLGGRVRLFKAFRDAMETAAERHFDGVLINCMSNPTEVWYHAPATNVIRTSTDFWPKDPASHGKHICTNAQVSAWFGEFIGVDWDMFHSKHAAGAFHAMARAISGGPVYVSDKPGEHDLELLRKLVCSDGSVPRCRQPGRPAPDCLYHDCTREPLLLKIFNRNDHGWVVGAFNANWHEKESERTELAGRIGPADVPGIAGTRFAIYLHNSDRLDAVEADEAVPLTLAEQTAEVATLARVTDGLAVLGLRNLFNASGAIVALQRDQAGATVSVRDGGVLLLWCEAAPQAIRVDGQATAPRIDGRRVEVDLSPGPHEVRIDL
jgi:raffinose synthase